MNEDDIPELYDIHRRFYEKEFDFPFGKEFRPLLDKYLVIDDNDKIITFGSLELSVEAIAITDLARTTREREEALRKLLEALKFSARNHNFNMFHCTIQDPKWESILKKHEFNNCKGSYLYLVV